MNLAKFRGFFERAIVLLCQAAKRGLDTITELTQVRLPEANIGKFVVLGASKVCSLPRPLGASDSNVLHFSARFRYRQMEPLVMLSSKSVSGYLFILC